ncbi:expressed tetratricopeptide repeat protein [Nitzschia inconspicua]|uniref:Tetratricopeptide repeat protein n=1 Tax=Nitzschia inconspicua TaxID=303405 RepID=A0A9K3K955_9STRA|nr:tetratricopeptide repeat protein [Nitzschia inconspicua]KAG7371611.1 expressed tetratricopeptide repeat protein [Nitzschia inconspicua]
MPFIPVAIASALQSLSNQTNKGVILFNQGNYDEAVQLFQDTVSASKNFLNSPHEEAESSASGEIMLSMRVLPSPRNNDLHCNKDTPVYTNAFDVAMTLAGGVEASCGQQMKQGNAVGGESCLLFSRLSIVLIYNLALAHHAAALSSTDSDARKRRTNLSKARDLYSLAYSIPQQDGKEIIDAALLPLFVQAILNNLGHCYASLDDREMSLACFELLLNSIIVSQQNLSEACLYDGRSIACFLDNTLFLILRNPRVAPAA